MSLQLRYLHSDNLLVPMVVGDFMPCISKLIRNWKKGRLQEELWKPTLSLPFLELLYFLKDCISENYLMGCSFLLPPWSEEKEVMEKGRSALFLLSKGLVSVLCWSLYRQLVWIPSYLRSRGIFILLGASACVCACVSIKLLFAATSREVCRNLSVQPVRIYQTKKAYLGCFQINVWARVLEWGFSFHYVATKQKKRSQN